MDLGYILRRAWRITWQHRLLWVFGCLVSLVAMGTRIGVSGSQWELAVQELPPEVQQPITAFLDRRVMVGARDSLDCISIQPAHFLDGAMINQQISMGCDG